LNEFPDYYSRLAVMEAEAETLLGRTGRVAALLESSSAVVPTGEP
jgi:hypothetical protein